MDKRVLLIEDEPNIVLAITFVLVHAGWQVTGHANGADAVEAVTRAAPDVVILDAMLPNKSGFDILRELRAAPATHSLPVLMLTARGQAKDRKMAEAYGVSRFMTKPFSNRELLAAIEALVAR